MSCGWTVRKLPCSGKCSLGVHRLLGEGIASSYSMVVRPFSICSNLPSRQACGFLTWGATWRRFVASDYDNEPPKRKNSLNRSLRASWSEMEIPTAQKSLTPHILRKRASFAQRRVTAAKVVEVGLTGSQFLKPVLQAGQDRRPSPFHLTRATHGRLPASRGVANVDVAPFGGLGPFAGVHALHPLRGAGSGTGFGEPWGGSEAWKPETRYIQTIHVWNYNRNMHGTK